MINLETLQQLRQYCRNDAAFAKLQRSLLSVESQSHQAAELQLQQQAARDRVLEAVALRIRQSLDLNAILSRTVDEVRQFFQTDRVLIYQFHDSESGLLVAASFHPNWNLDAATESHQAW